MKSSIIRSAHVLIATIALFAYTVPATAASVLMVREKLIMKGTPEEIWKKIGGFCAIAEWNPAVKSCKEGKDGDKVTRTLTLQDGGTVKEAKTDGAATNYSYTVLEGALPVEHVDAAFKLKKRKEGVSMLIWSASFAAHGKSDDEAKAAVEAIIKPGLESLQAMFPTE